MSLFNERLKEERSAKDLTQEEFSVLGGVKKQAQLNYEKGKRVPDLLYLANLAEAGIDIQYIVTGVRSTHALNEVEQKLMGCFKNADAGKKAAIMAVAESQAEELHKKEKKKPV